MGIMYTVLMAFIFLCIMESNVHYGELSQQCICGTCMGAKMLMHLCCYCLVVSIYAPLNKHPRQTPMCYIELIITNTIWPVFFSPVWGSGPGGKQKGWSHRGRLQVFLLWRRTTMTQARLCYQEPEKSRMYYKELHIDHLFISLTVNFSSVCYKKIHYSTTPLLDHYFVASGQTE